MSRLILCLFLCFLTQYSVSSLDVTVFPDIVLSEPIAPNFASFSIEHNTAMNWIGRIYNNSYSEFHHSFVVLMRHLIQTPYQQGPVFRIGGNSADYSIWNPAHGPLPTFPAGVNISYSITESDLISLKQAITLINSKLIIGLNFHWSDNFTLGISHAKALEKYIGWELIHALEVGNECDLYTRNGIRSSSYTGVQYLKEFSGYVKQLYAEMPDLPKPIIQGSTFSGVGEDWGTAAELQTQQFSNLLISQSLHHYPGDHCKGHSVPMNFLLSNRAQSEGIDSFLPIINNVTTQGIPFVLGEGNSCACSGTPGVSNVYGSALWAIDTLFSWALAGMKMFNFHGGLPNLENYSALVWLNPHVDKVNVASLFYGIYFFTLATANHSTIVATNFNEPTAESLKVWTSNTPTNSDGYSVIKTTIINKDYQSTQPQLINLNFGLDSECQNNQVQVTRLLSSGNNIFAQNGITYAGQTWDNTVGGELIGKYNEELLDGELENGLFVYSIKVDSASAVLVTCNAFTDPQQ
jgi:hypothetical protein